MAQNLQRFPRRDDRTAADLKTPIRNRYFYGKLLDVHQLEQEQEYFNAKRWLLNRLVTGPGVVCGLKVELTDDHKHVTVKPGLAIDRCGHEIMVPSRSRPADLPELPPYEAKNCQSGYQGRTETQRYYKEREHQRHHHCIEPYAHVLLCYHECPADPVPVTVGTCDAEEMCASGSIREQYRVEVRRGFVQPRTVHFPEDITEDGMIDYEDLVDYVMNRCRLLPEHCCLPLANIELRDDGSGWKPVVDNAVRPIVYNNRLLFDLIDGLARGDTDEEEEEETEQSEV
jgi:hypothetical protein